MADGGEDDVGGVAGGAFEIAATEVAIGQNWSRKSAQCDRWSFCLTTGRFSLRIRRRLCRDDRAGTTRRLSRRRRYSPPSRAIGRSGLEACSTAHYLNKQTYPPKLSGSGISRDVGASGSRNVTRVSSIAVTRITSGIGSSITAITAVSTADDAFVPSSWSAASLFGKVARLPCRPCAVAAHGADHRGLGRRLGAGSMSGSITCRMRDRSACAAGCWVRAAGERSRHRADYLQRYGGTPIDRFHGFARLGLVPLVANGVEANADAA